MAFFIRSNTRVKLDADAPQDRDNHEDHSPVDCASPCIRQEPKVLELAVVWSDADRLYRMQKIAAIDPEGSRLRFAGKFEDGVYT